MANVASAMFVEVGGRRWRVDAHAHDLSIPLAFDAPQPTFFGAAPARAVPIATGSFIGEVQQGGSCNCATYTLTPHCNGTHTECVGHVTKELLGIRDVAQDHLCAALLVSVAPVAAEQTSEASEPAPQAGDRLITRQALAAAAAVHDYCGYRALVIRTLPNEAAKLTRNYDSGPTPPYFSAQAMQWIVDRDITALVVDLPSLDRANDAGRLTAHRIFWGLPPGATSAAYAVRREATVTELVYIDDGIADGPYLLNLQVAPFVADAAPSRPILLALTPA